MTKRTVKLKELEKQIMKEKQFLDDLNSCLFVLNICNMAYIVVAACCSMPIAAACTSIAWLLQMIACAILNFVKYDKISWLRNEYINEFVKSPHARHMMSLGKAVMP